MPPILGNFQVISFYARLVCSIAVRPSAGNPLWTTRTATTHRLPNRQVTTPTNSTQNLKINKLASVRPRLFLHLPPLSHLY
ncbi:hypothetical protein FIBSPDRAFT_982597 [Athelia psychrophila]|uniref:Uncharacterized protein n=1 Tax=Athelia psychrophila TaxID=1759441 RepID=A0A166CD20_9AGAM|nr:hypothetical protein FIBSPDRAFT_982597 [Fibularhizoctonia sp. CBS 109695]